MKMKPIAGIFLMLILCCCFCCCIVITTIATFSPYQVEGASMEPNYHQDEVWLTQRNTAPKLGSVIIFTRPGGPAFIKRVVGLPGDVVNIKEGKVYINNFALAEPYLSAGEYTRVYGNTADEYPMTVPVGEYFVLGDNRNNSLDSRNKEIGFVKKEWIKGEVWLRMWPLK